MEIQNYEPNSHKYNEEKAVQEARRPQPVVQGKVVPKKRKLFSRFKDDFIKEDPKTVRKYLWNDVIKPAILDNVFDIITNAYDMTFRGEKSSRRRSNLVNSLGSRINYGGFFSNDKREKMPTYRNSDTTHDFRQLCFESRAEAETVLDNMLEIIGQYKQVTLLDLYDLAGITSENHTDNKFGWRELGGAKVKGDSKYGYYIDFPKCTSLE